MDLVSFSCRRVTTFPSNICWRGCLFSVAYFWHLCQKEVGILVRIHICHYCPNSYWGFLNTKGLGYLRYSLSIYVSQMYFSCIIYCFLFYFFIPKFDIFSMLRIQLTLWKCKFVKFFKSTSQFIWVYINHKLKRIKALYSCMLWTVLPVLFVPCPLLLFLTPMRPTSALKSEPASVSVEILNWYRLSQLFVWCNMCSCISIVT
jgi:hypothetical protein